MDFFSLLKRILRFLAFKLCTCVDVDICTVKSVNYVTNTKICNTWHDKCNCNILSHRSIEWKISIKMCIWWRKFHWFIKMLKFCFALRIIDVMHKHLRTLKAFSLRLFYKHLTKNVHAVFYSFKTIKFMIFSCK